MSERLGWFEVDKEGLAKIVARKGLSFVLYELVQNAWDTNATHVVVKMTSVPDRPLVTFRIEDDDPEGFKTLDHGYRLFAESIKKGDPTKRGRFNLGEKLVLAACVDARLSSTTGTIYFETHGKDLVRRQTRERRERGTVFEATVRMTRAELTKVCNDAGLLLPPIRTTINDIDLSPAKPIHIFGGTLPTEIADEEGYLRSRQRSTMIRVHPKSYLGPAYLYELGIPVVELDLPWSVEVMQKIPLNSDRDNVTPSYRKALAVLVVNAMHEHMKPEHAGLPMIQEALESEAASPEAIGTILTHQHGKDRVVFDPSDREANSNAFSKGFSVISGGSYSKAQWESIRRAGAVRPAGQVFPTPKTYDPEGEIARIIPESEWTGGMFQVAEYAKGLAWELMGVRLTVVMENEPSQWYGANYGGQRLTFNAKRLGDAWFNTTENGEQINDLLLHEFGHEYAGNHLSADYYKALTRLAAKMVRLALTRPSFFQAHEFTF